MTRDAASHDGYEILMVPSELANNFFPSPDGTLTHTAESDNTVKVLLKCKDTNVGVPS